MLHDIDGRYDNQYKPRAPRPGDEILAFRGGSLLMRREGDWVELPAYSPGLFAPGGLIFLFDISGRGYFLAPGHEAPAGAPGHDGIDAGQVEAAPDDGGWRYEPLGIFRWIRPRETRFAVEVASQLAAWYDTNRFCGRCAAPMQRDGRERMLRCDACGNTVYPRINPGIIVAVEDGDELLLTKYAGRGFTNWALVAGFTEIGESLEQTVEREVMEETGVRVKDIRYFSNQPWPRSSSLLVGFFAKLDGPRDVRVDEDELACAEWVNWRDVPHDPDGYSLTRTMMCAFHDRKAREQG